MSDPSISGNASWDVIVVGSGATGGVAAKTLSEGGCRVLVIEAGRNLSPKQTFPGELTNTIGRLLGITLRPACQITPEPYWQEIPLRCGGGQYAVTFGVTPPR